MADGAGEGPDTSWSGLPFVASPGKTIDAWISRRRCAVTVPRRAVRPLKSRDHDKDWRKTMTMFNRRAALGTMAAGGLAVAAGAAHAQDANALQPKEPGRGGTDQGPRDLIRDQENPSFLNPPRTDSDRVFSPGRTKHEAIPHGKAKPRVCCPLLIRIWRARKLNKWCAIQRWKDPISTHKVTSSVNHF